MKISLNLKKRILSGALAIIVSGNVISIFVPAEVLERITSTPAYAASISYESNYVVNPSIITTYEQRNLNDIEKKMVDIDLNKEQVRKVEAYLASRGAPLAAHAKTFVKVADKYGLPYNLMPAISIIESSGGLYNYRPYNYAGMGGQGNAKTFSSYEEAIEYHAAFLKSGYFDKGADTPEEIEQYYCYQCPTWGEKVQGVMNSIDAM